MTHEKVVRVGARLCALALIVGLACVQPLAAQASGAIEGTVTLRQKRALRSAGRYPGASPAARTIQAVPPVVYVEGTVPGLPPVPTSSRIMAQHDTAFVPAALVVDVGSIVHFPNDDPFYHNVFSYSPAARFDLGRYPRGEAKDVTFDDAGIVKIYCEVHDFMRSIVVVTENPLHAVADDDGRFRIDGVPAGTYTLTFWHPDVEPVKREVTVSAGGTAQIEVELR